jgi:hypothetical protein
MAWHIDDFGQRFNLRFIFDPVMRSRLRSRDSIEVMERT